MRNSIYRFIDVINGAPVWLFLLFYKFALDLFLFIHLFPEPNVVQFNYGQPEIVKVIFGYFLTLILGVCLDKFPLRSDFLRFYNYFFLVVLVVPLISLSGQQSRSFDGVAYVLLAFFICYLIFLFSERISIQVVRPNLFLFVFGFICLGLLYVYYFGGLLYNDALSWFNVNFYNVYDVREKYSELQLPLSGYLLSWLFYVVNIFLIVLSVANRRYLLTGLFLLLQFLVYGMTNHKTLVFIPVVVLALFLVFRFFKMKVVIFFASLCVFSMVLVAFLDPMIEALVLRAFYTPAALHTLYFDFFSSNPYAFLSGTRWSFLFESIYSETHVSVVAQEFWGRKFSPNVGWVGSAFANFGILGILGYSLILSVFLRIIDSFISVHEDKTKYVVCCFPILFSIFSTSFNTVLLTHGGFVLIFVLWLMSYKPKIGRSL